MAKNKLYEYKEINSRGAIIHLAKYQGEKTGNSTDGMDPQSNHMLMIVNLLNHFT
jgi:hypothetical protein